MRNDCGHTGENRYPVSESNWRCSAGLALCSALPAGILFLVLPRKSSQKEVAPTASPGYAGCSALLSRNGRAAHPKGTSCGAELGAAPLRQSSPFFPLRPALLDDAEDKLKTLRVSTAHHRIRLRSVCAPPLGEAEQRSTAGGSRRGLSEGRSPEFRSRPTVRV